MAVSLGAALLGGAVAGGAASIYGAKKAAKATQNAAGNAADTERYIYDRNVELNQPFYDQGLSALPDLSESAYGDLPSYEDTVSKPMEDWDYEQTPAYQAKYSLGMEELNKQLSARGLASSGVGASRAADLGRRLTSEDYNTERNYARGDRTDIYKSRLADNTTRYQRLLDQVKMGTGASSAMGQAGNQYASGVGQASMAAGEAKAGFYSGLGGVPSSTMATGLKAYDVGNRAGWWGNSGGGSPAAYEQPLFNGID